MKMKQEHYEHMKEAIDNLCNARLGNITRYIKVVRMSGKYMDLSTRIRWDILKAAQLDNYLVNTLYTYLNNDHVDTALRRIMKDKPFYKSL